MKIRTAIAAVSLVLTCGTVNAAGPVKSQPYTWKSAQIVGGGFCDGIIFHPTAKDVRYVRTDMGGAYRWDADAQRWACMTDFIGYSELNLVGIESIAVDPNDPKTVYMDCGTNSSTKGAILRSHDGGLTFEYTYVPFGMGGNENGRGNGERMMVDPNNSDIIYVGTRKAGLWRSTDRGVSFQEVKSFNDFIKDYVEPEIQMPPMQRGPQAGPQGGPQGGQQPQMTDEQRDLMRRAMEQRQRMGCGVVFVLFDKSTAKGKEGSQTIYVGYSQMQNPNMFVSHDGGKTWSVMEGAPQQYMPNHAVMSTDRCMYVTFGTNPGPNKMTNGGVWKYDIKADKWTEITPVKPDEKTPFGYAAVSVDLQNPKHLVCTTFGLHIGGENSGEDVYRSTDGGKTWKGAFASGGKYDPSNAPYVIHTGIHWLFDVEIDPCNPDHVIFTTGYGGWETYNLGDMDKNKPTLWTVMSKGIEQTVPLELYSPNKGAWLISGIGDYGGFTHHDLDKPASDSHHDPRFGNTNAVAGAELKPELIVRSGTIHGGYTGKNLSYSLDGGDTWLEPETIPEGRNGHVAVGSDGEVWVWTPDRSPVYYTSDYGKTWNQSEGIPAGQRVIADKVNPKRFYSIQISTGLLYESNDGAKTFTSREVIKPVAAQPGQRMNRGDSRGGQDRVYSVPGREGDLWIAAFDGLYHAPEDGDFSQMCHVNEIHAFGLGAPKPGSNYPALYLVGTVDGVRGFFRSDDEALSWVRINDDQHQYGLVLHITGDPKKYGRVYVGTHGRGVVYGDPK